MAGQFDTQFAIGLKDNFSTRYRQIRDEVKQAQQARERLGIKSEQSIRNEIRQTENAYQQLARSSIVSAGEQARAFDKMTEKVSRLRRELGETERVQGRLAKGLKVAGTLGAGAVGAAVALRRPIENYNDYDSQVRNTANFVYRTQGADERIAGIDTINQQVMAATRYGGGKPEEALTAIDTMSRSKMSNDQVFSALPGVMKIHSATDTPTEDIASLVSASANFGLDKKDLNATLDAATTASQHGKVGVSVLAREAPRGLENARGAGFHGSQGYAEAMALYEVGAMLAGTASEGATNVNDLFSELSSTSLSNNAGRVKIHGKKLDYKAMAIHDARQGHNGLYTLEHVVRAVDDNDPTMAGLRKKLNNTTDATQRENLDSAIRSRHRQNVGLFLHNQQSRDAFQAYETYKETYGDIVRDAKQQFTLSEGQRSTDVDYSVIKGSNSFRDSQARNEAFYATSSVVKPAANVWGDIEGRLTQLAQEFPTLAKASAAAALAITALGTAAALKTGGRVLSGVLRKGGAVLDEAGAVTEEVATGGGSKSGMLRAVKNVLRGAAGSTVRYVRTLATDGLLENPLTLGAGLMLYPSSTVDGRTEADELARKKRINQQHNRPSEDALHRLQNWPGHNSDAGQAPVINLPAQPTPEVHVLVQLDSHDIAAAIQVLLEQNNRRYGQ